MTNDTKAPERIWAWPTYSWLSGAWAQTRFPETAESYTRTDLAFAAQGALIERAAEVMKGVTKPKIPPLNMGTKEAEAFDEGQEGAILAMQERIRSIPPDAMSALNHDRRQVRAEERERIANRVKRFADTFDGKSDDAKERRARGVAIAIYHDIMGREE